MADTLTMDGARRTADGYLAASVLVARTGIQDYAGFEVGRPDLKTVRVYRPADQVFDDAAMASFAHRPVTLDHPRDAVTAENWKKLAIGQTGDEVKQDGKFIRVPMALMDAAAIKAVESGKRELSMGYSCDLKWEAGQTGDGEPYDAIQTNIHANHLAVVDRARGGSKLRIGDGSNGMHTLMIDGLQVVEVSDSAKAAIEKLQGDLTKITAAKDAAETKIATLATDGATKDAKITTLEQQVKDAKLTPSQLRDAAKAYALVVDKAKQLGVAVSDEMDEPAIMKAAVTAKVGDAAKDWNDAQISASFGTLTASLGDSRPDALRDAIRHQPAVIADAAAIRNAARTSRYAN